MLLLAIFALALAPITLLAAGGATSNHAGDADPTIRPLTAAAVGVARPEEARERLLALRAEIARHDALYYRKAAPEISDANYDALKLRLQQLEAAFPGIATELVGAVGRVGDDRTGLFLARAHREPMLGLDKVMAEADLRAFDARLVRRLWRDDLDYVVEPKYDGFAVSVIYERGRLIRAISRGNGFEGDDLTANVMRIRGLPRELRASTPEGGAVPIPEWIELRGEIYATFAEFRRINREREAAELPEFATPRNFAAGTIRQVDAQELAQRNLEIVFHGFGGCVPESALPATQQAWHARLRAWGLPTVERSWTARGPEELVAAVRAMQRAQAALLFPTDGAVVKLDSLAGQRDVGAGSSAPRWALAYKFGPERAETQLLGITLQVGRTGVLTPVAELSQVRLAGSNVSRATLYNRDEIARKDIRVGDWVYVEKAGDIIPAVVGVNVARRGPTSQSYAFPESCPSCQSELVAPPGVAAVRCSNHDCPAQVRRRLEHFASKEGVGIDGLGPATIAALVERGNVREPADLYRLRPADLRMAPGLAERSTERLIAAIDASRRAELWRFIAGLGIPGVGGVGSKEAARRFGSLAALATADPQGDPVSRALAVHFSEARHRASLQALVAAGIRPRGPDVAGTAGALAGKVLVLTGALESLTRAQATERIEAAGGRVVGTVTAATDIVVAGRDPGANFGQARALGVEVIDEVELLRLLAAE